MYREQKSFTPTNFRLRSFGFAVTLGSMLIASASASIIQTGQANIAGTAVVGSNFVNFSNNGVNNTYTAQQPNTGGFSGLTGGTISNLALGTTTQPQFVTFNVTPTVANPTGVVFFDLQGFNPGTGTNAACGSNVIGTSCTPAGSSFTLTQKAASQVEFDLGVFGIAYAGASSTGSSATSALFTTQNLVPGTITGVLNQIAQSGSITNSYSATFSAVAPAGVPEPASMLLFGAGLLAVGMLGKIKRAF